MRLELHFTNPNPDPKAGEYHAASIQLLASLCFGEPWGRGRARVRVGVRVTVGRHTFVLTLTRTLILMHQDELKAFGLTA